MIEAVIIENLKKIILKNNIRFNLYEELKFKKAEYYIEKYGNEAILAPYYDTKNRFNSTKWGKEKTIEEFEKERKSNIIRYPQQKHSHNDPIPQIHTSKKTH